jgi:uncharacterized protein (DUF2267 family)
MSHEHEQFITTIEQHARLSFDEAQRAAQAVLQTLAERLSAGEARQIAAQLPPEDAPWLGDGGPAQPMHADEFVRRVAGREGVDEESAERHIRAVFAALGRSVSRKELADMASELPKDFEPLVAPAWGARYESTRTEILPAETFLRRVADRAGLDEAGARRATDAVLETLAERISHGEVDDLAALLPVELHPALRRGDAESNRAATKMSLARFVERVAQREGVTPDEAQEHARAVFATLREAVGEKEFTDVTDQLPRDYAVLEARA